MPQDLIDNYSILALVKAWCRQAINISWANIDLDLCRHIVSPSHNDLNTDNKVPSGKMQYTFTGFDSEIIKISHYWRANAAEMNLQYCIHSM